MRRLTRRALGLVALYVLVGSLWILVSDALVEVPRDFPGPQTWKGLFFVLGTGAFLFWIVRRELERTEETADRVRFQAALLEAVGEAVIATDLDGEILYWNRAAEELYGWSAEEVLGRYIVEVTPTDATRERAVEIMDAIRAGEQWYGEFEVRRKDGSTFPAGVTDTPIYDRDGSLVGIVGVSRDLTFEKQAERELREREERFRALIEDTTDLTTILDVEGNIRYSSPARERVLGRRVELGENIFREGWLHPEDRERIERALEEILVEPDESVTARARIRHADGRWVPMEHQARNLLESPAIEGIVVHSRDMSEREELQRRLVQARKMEAVGRLAGGIAHDFNNFLTGILGNVEFLLEELESGDRIREDLRQIHRSALRASTLTRQLLAFSRQQVLKPEVLDLNGIVVDLRAMLDRLIEERIRLVTDLDAELGSVRIDAGQMEQVVVNLVMNARDAMPEGGTVTVRTANVTLTEDDTARFDFPMDPGDYVALEVGDTGTGMDAETREHVFEPFFTTKEQGEGTGLGLSSVYGVVKQSGGWVDVRTEPGEGTVVVVYLPAVEGPGTGRRSSRGAEPARGSETVLVVEDDESIRDVVRRTLERWGHTVLEAEDGREGLAVLEAHPETALVVADLVMPEMGGRELADRLDRREGSPEILFMSGYASDEAVRDSLMDEEQNFLPKPFTPDELALRVREILDRREE